MRTTYGMLFSQTHDHCRYNDQNQHAELRSLGALTFNPFCPFPPPSYHVNRTLKHLGPFSLVPLAGLLRVNQPCISNNTPAFVLFCLLLKKQLQQPRGSMPRPPREDVHRHFSPIPERGASPGPGAQHDQHSNADLDAANGSPAGSKSKAFKHARVRCRHCSWRSKRDASRQAKHLSLCAEYRAWCALHGEQIVSLTASGARRDSLPASASPGVGPARVGSDGAGGGGGAGGESNYFAAGSAASAYGAEGATRRSGSMAMGQAGHVTHGSGSGSGSGSGYLSPPMPTNPRTGAYQHRSVPYGGGASGAQQAHVLSVMGHGSGSSTPQYQQGAHSRPQSSSLDPTRGGFQVQGLGEAERRRLNILYARALVAIGIRDNDFYDPSRHPQMCAFLKALNPGYEPPPKEELGALVVREFFGGMGGGDGTGVGVHAGTDGGQGQGQGNAEGEDGRGNIFS